MFNTKVTWISVLSALIVFGNQIIPILPPVWSNLIGAILGVIALYYHADVVRVARAQGVKGI